jgi:hypothetical protein
MPFFIARQPGRSGRVCEAAFRSNAAVVVEESAGRSGWYVKRLGRGLKVALMLRVVVCGRNCGRSEACAEVGRREDEDSRLAPLLRGGFGGMMGLMLWL